MRPSDPKAVACHRLGSRQLQPVYNRVWSSSHLMVTTLHTMLLNMLLTQMEIISRVTERRPWKCECESLSKS